MLEEEKSQENNEKMKFFDLEWLTFEATKQQWVLSAGNVGIISPSGLYLVDAGLCKQKFIRGYRNSKSTK